MNKLPDKIFGIDTEDAYKRFLKRKESKEEPGQKPLVRIPTIIEDPNDFIIINSRYHGDYHSPDLLVQIHKLRYTSEVEQASKTLGFNVSDTSEESDKTPYIGNINHEQALSLNQRLGNVTLSPINVTDLIYRLIQAIKGNETILYEDGKTQVPKEILKYMLNEMIEVRAPYRAEWLGARFGSKSITYNKFDSHVDREVTERLDSDTLMEDRNPGINLESYVTNPTSHGLPRENVEKGDFCYWYPRDRKGVRLGAGSDGAGLLCYGDPSGLDGRLGVRAAKILRSI